MDTWLRPMLTRKQPTPLSTPSHEQPPSCSSEDNSHNNETILGYRSSSRLSLSFRSTPTFPPPPASADAFPNFKQPQTPWIPSPSDQLVELLKVAIMNRGSMDPLPVQYNSTVLQVLEAYYTLQIQLESNSHSIDVLKRAHEKDIKEFETMACGWHEKERDYQAEIKKLEVLLSETDAGMESVSMARSQSLLHGSTKATETIARGIGTIKARNATDHCEDARASRGFGDSLAQQVESPDQKARSPYEGRTYLGNSSQGTDLSGAGKLWGCKGKASDIRRQRLTRAKLAAFERQNISPRPRRSVGIRYEDSSTDSTFSSNDDNSSGAINFQEPYIQEKPLPETPAGLVDCRRQTTLNRFFGQESKGSLACSFLDTSVPHQLSFSFQPGDDVDIFSNQAERDRDNRRTVDDLLNKRMAGSFSTNTADCKIHQLPSSGSKPSPLPNTKPRLGKLTASSRNLADLQDSDFVKRGASNSSIITAIRDNSGRGSIVGGSKKNKHTGRAKLDRNIGSSKAAVTAAVKATATANGKKSPKQPELGSEAQSDGDRGLEAVKCQGEGE